MQNKKIVYFIMLSILITVTGIILILTDKPDEKPEISEKNFIKVNSGDGSSIVNVETINTITETTYATSKRIKESTKNTKKSEGKKDLLEDESQNSITEIEKVNLNTATVEELMRLPDIDAEMADKIIELRSTIQYFSHPYELLYVEGMTERRLSKIIDYIVVEQVYWIYYIEQIAYN